jgi:hypothetical protein
MRRCCVFIMCIVSNISSPSRVMCSGSVIVYSLSYTRQRTLYHIWSIVHQAAHLVSYMGYCTPGSAPRIIYGVLYTRQRTSYHIWSIVHQVAHLVSYMGYYTRWHTSYHIWSIVHQVAHLVIYMEYCTPGSTPRIV